ncbi:MAG: hypothetical protein OP8BY_1328 [Candidatus Saccharicenans subterraneus]|uniref:Uncharacterized protein n=1 Tax=Candidatus Saccharicenans subterraneus TaxID=2508984 RepID=A0A3E2BPQ0_9BACT|nr:MAG: hypothetical protein OP8BY_1328 [Candidatus Saccharicenans subterraneum]
MLWLKHQILLLIFFVFILMAGPKSTAGRALAARPGRAPARLPGPVAAADHLRAIYFCAGHLSIALALTLTFKRKIKLN